MLEFGNGGKGEGRLRWIVLYVDTKQTKVVVWDVDTKVGETKKINQSSSSSSSSSSGTNTNAQMKCYNE